MTISTVEPKVTVGQAAVAIRAGHAETVAVQLNDRGKRLLAAQGKLSVSLAVTQTVSGRKRVVDRQRLVL